MGVIFSAMLYVVALLPDIVSHGLMGEGSDSDSLEFVPRHGGRQVGGCFFRAVLEVVDSCEIRLRLGGMADKLTRMLARVRSLSEQA